MQVGHPRSRDSQRPPSRVHLTQPPPSRAERRDPTVSCVLSLSASEATSCLASLRVWFSLSSSSLVAPLSSASSLAFSSRSRLSSCHPRAYPRESDPLQTLPSGPPSPSTQLGLSRPQPGTLSEPLNVETQ